MDATERHCRAVADLNSRNTVGTDQLYEGFRTADKATEVGSADDSDAPGNFQFIAVCGNGRICEEADIAVIGFNCTNGVKPVESAVKALSAVCGKPIVAYPAAGQPLMAANRFCKELEQLCRAGMLNIVGGCCGTTPEYTSHMTKMAARWRPHKFERRR